eukprot:TRINITY_DN3513_c0_g1_i1.p1 TRINITY_DN3513_c0_g1~~TRINITY_DN3513_c0_g1_i1.p1  ORF type:complete len:325 (-),score=56.13 TRINITY_DN3513_c0_g1_i1:363-1337(-)
MASSLQRGLLECGFEAYSTATTRNEMEETSPICLASVKLGGLAYLRKDSRLTRGMKRVRTVEFFGGKRSLRSNLSVSALSSLSSSIIVSLSTNTSPKNSESDDDDAVAWANAQDWNEEELDALIEEFGEVVFSSDAQSEDVDEEEFEDAEFSNSSSYTFTQDPDFSTVAVRALEMEGLADEAAPISTSEGERVEVAALPSDSDAEGELLALSMAVAAYDGKGSDILVLRVKSLVYWTSYFVIVTAFSRPQVEAIARRMRDAAEENFNRIQAGGDRGSNSSSWTLLDFGDVVCHVFLPKEREFYDLERFYTNAPRLQLPFQQANL